jgi:hypothetical protein
MTALGGRRNEGGVEMLAEAGCGGAVALLLWVVAVALVVWGIVTIVRGALLMGIVFVVIGLLVGPGGVSVFC